MKARTDWRRALASGALWAVVYNFVWGVAWFAVMRGEWTRASASAGMPMPWSAEVWFGWALLTVVIGAAVMAYAATESGAAMKRSLIASLTTCVLMVTGMAIWCVQESIPSTTIALDSIVNLAGMVAAALVGGWSLQAE